MNGVAQIGRPVRPILESGGGESVITYEVPAGCILEMVQINGSGLSDGISDYFLDFFVAGVHLYQQEFGGVTFELWEFPVGTIQPLYAFGLEVIEVTTSGGDGEFSINVSGRLYSDWSA